MPLNPGQALGNYRILSQIGVGGMGIVYLAEHPLIGKKVALKVIHQELSRNREVVARFFREAKAVNTIGNEHIVEINDFGQTENGDHFLIMEYLEGQTLADLLQTERVLDCARSAKICAQISSALGAAHAVGIIHRDLKPDNVMLTPKHGDHDFVKLLDFGLAKMLADSDAQQLTAQGVVLGTPQYMSPEACESKKNIDARADIYSLGVLMFQMMTGALPFTGPAMGEILVKHVTQPPPAPRGINPDIPPAIEQVLLRCLAKDPDSRFPTMLKLREALLDPDRYLSSSPPVMPSAPVARPGAQTMFDHGGVPMPRAVDDKPTVIGKRTGNQPAMSVETPPSEKRTLFVEGVAPPPTSAPPPMPGQDGAQTAMMGTGAQPVVGPPDMPQPMPASNRTMVIGTPHGYSNQPPRKKWPLVLALFVILGGGGVTIAILLYSNNDHASASTEPSESTAAGSDEKSPPDEDKSSPGDKESKSEPDQPVLAKVTLNSSPAGAVIFDDKDNKLGVTPTVLELPSDGHKRVIELRHPKAKTRTKTLLVTGDVAVTVEMELLPEGENQPPDAGAKEAKQESEADAAPSSEKHASTKKKRDRHKPKKKKKKKVVKDDGVLPPDFDE